VQAVSYPPHRDRAYDTAAISALLRSVDRRRRCAVTGSRECTTSWLKKLELPIDAAVRLIVINYSGVQQYWEV
jgi:hypothetical protein